MASRQHAGFKSAGDFWRRKYEAERTAVNALRDDFVKAACEWYVESQAVEYDVGNANYGLAVRDARRLTESIKSTLDRWTKKHLKTNNHNNNTKKGERK